MVFSNIRQHLLPLLRSSPVHNETKDSITAYHHKTVTFAANTPTKTQPDIIPESSLPSSTAEDVAATSAKIVIAGGGIVGLVMALALHHHGVCHQVHVYEQAPAFQEDVGAGMGLYPNGLRVIRDMSPVLLKRLKEAGCPYQYRRWMRHDGTEVAVADESVLARKANYNVDDDAVADTDIQPIGIRRWKLQQILYDAAAEAGIVIHFGKRLNTITELANGAIQLQFEDETACETDLLLAADGAKSKIRSIVTNDACQLKYIGTTCLMGTSSTPRKDRGLSLPSSPTTRCHGAFYPTGETEQCFQFHFPTPLDDVASATMGGWGGMTYTMSQEECTELAQQLDKEGWDADRFVQPLQNVEKALRIGLTTLDPPLKTFSFGRVILIGDAAHPPVPYLGQGAQQGLEDAGTLALLLKEFCVVRDGQNDRFSLDKLDDALKIYNELRVPRTNDIVERGKQAGQQQQKRAENRKYNRVREELIQRDIFYNEHSKLWFAGARHDYKEAVELSLNLAKNNTL